MYHKRETEEERRERETKEDEKRQDRQERNLTRILAAGVGNRDAHRKEEETRQKGYLGNEGPRRPQNPEGPPRQPLVKGQCAYCKEKGHWARDLPKKQHKTPKVLTLEEDD